jgi:hypothetical protein
MSQSRNRLSTGALVAIAIVMGGRGRGCGHIREINLLWQCARA